MQRAVSLAAPRPLRFFFYAVNLWKQEMKQAPTVWKLSELSHAVATTSTQIDGKWVPVRPLWYTGLRGLKERFRASWLVFTGRADAVVWPKGQ